MQKADNSVQKVSPCWRPTQSLSSRGLHQVTDYPTDLDWVLYDTVLDIL